MNTGGSSGEGDAHPLHPGKESSPAMRLLDSVAALGLIKDIRFNMGI